MEFAARFENLNNRMLRDGGFDAALTTKKAVNVSVRVLFDREKQMVDLLNAGGGLKSFDPTVQILTSEAEKYGIERGTTEIKLTDDRFGDLRGARFKVCEKPEPDGAGFTLLQLKKA